MPLLRRGAAVGGDDGGVRRVRARVRASSNSSFSKRFIRVSIGLIRLAALI